MAWRTSRQRKGAEEREEWWRRARHWKHRIRRGPIAPRVEVPPGPWREVNLTARIAHRESPEESARKLMTTHPDGACSVRLLAQGDRIVTVPEGAPPG